MSRHLDGSEVTNADGWIVDCGIRAGECGEHCGANDGEDCDACQAEGDAEMAYWRDQIGDTRTQSSPEDVRNHVPGVRVCS